MKVQVGGTYFVKRKSDNKNVKIEIVTSNATSFLIRDTETEKKSWVPIGDFDEVYEEQDGNPQGDPQTEAPDPTADLQAGPGNPEDVPTDLRGDDGDGTDVDATADNSGAEEEE